MIPLSYGASDGGPACRNPFRAEAHSLLSIGYAERAVLRVRKTRDSRPRQGKVELAGCLRCQWHVIQALVN